MPDNLSAFVCRHLPLVEEQLRLQLPESSLEGAERLNEAVRYAVFSGGKRWRPLLTLMAAQAFHAPPEQALAAASGVEFLHLASVILDDLPAMDDAKMRRHVPALHLAFDEATAILTALALYTRAFEIFAPCPGMVQQAAQAVGCNGMIGGQAADLRAVAGTRLTKTTALMRFALQAGAGIGTARRDELAALGEVGELMGAAYQLRDDLLDAMGSESATGKTGCQDSRHNRRVLTPECDVDTVVRRLKGLVECATETIRGQLRRCPQTELMCEFAESLWTQAAVLLHGHYPDSADSDVLGARCRQRSTVAAGEAGSSEPGRPPFGPNPRA
jgi:geranylgeranyl pyrophosphate synthase